MHLLAKERDGGIKSELILCLSWLPAEADTTNMNIVDLFQDQQTLGQEFSYSKHMKELPFH